jgi:hypothetical protein
LGKEVFLIFYQREVRSRINKLLGIMHDVDIMEVSHLSMDEVTAFANEVGPGPKLKPM